jgi:molybdopterin synthase sulfur carrier subunit
MYNHATMSEQGHIRVTIPFHLRNLAKCEREVTVHLNGKPATIANVLDALEAKHPVLRGTIRDHGTLKRRDFLRYYACTTDLSLEPGETPLPTDVVNGKEPFMVVGAIAGG